MKCFAVLQRPSPQVSILNVAEQLPHHLCNLRNIQSKLRHLHKVVSADVQQISGLP